MTPIPKPRTSGRNKYDVVRRLKVADALGLAARFTVKGADHARLETLRRIVRATAHYNGIRVRTRIEDGAVKAWIREGE